MQLFGKVHRVARTVTSTSRRRHFLLELQAIKASPRKSASPNIEHSWNDFTQVPPSSSTHPESDGHVNTVHNQNRAGQRSNGPGVVCIPGENCFHSSHIVCMLKFFSPSVFSSLLDHCFQNRLSKFLQADFSVSSRAPRVQDTSYQLGESPSFFRQLLFLT